MSDDPSGKIPEVKEVDDIVLRDLESKFSAVACPIHGSPPSFDVAPDGSVVEHMCCEALREIVRELQAKEEGAGPAAEGDGGEGA